MTAGALNSLTVKVAIGLALAGLFVWGCTSADQHKKPDKATNDANEHVTCPEMPPMPIPARPKDVCSKSPTGHHEWMRGPGDDWACFYCDKEKPQ